MRHLRIPFQVIAGFYLAHEFLALFLLLLIEEAGIPLPIPGDALVAWAGARHARAPGSTLEVLAVSSAGVFIGSTLLYTLMRRRGRPLLDKFGRYLHLSGKRLDRMERWFRRHGLVAILCGRMIPGLRIPTTVMAGLSEVPYRTYALACAITAVAWAALYFYLGEVLQRPMTYITTRVLGRLDTVSDWLILVIVLALVAAVATTWYLRRRARQRNAPPPTGGTGPETAPTPEPSGVA